MAIVKKSYGHGGGSPSRRPKSKTGGSPSRFGMRLKKSKPTPEMEEPPTTMKVAIVSRNRATETTPATQPPTPGMLDSFVDSVQGGLEACGVLEKGSESASSQMHKWQSGQRVGGEKFAKAPVWGIAPVLSDDEEDDPNGDQGGEGEYDDVELVLQQTPDRTGGARTTTAAAAAGAGDGVQLETREARNLAVALEAEAQAQRLEQREVVDAARRQLLQQKREGRRQRERAALAAAAASGANAAPMSGAASVRTEDFVDASVASALETWRSATDPATGRTYYYNRVTKETKWDPPPELVEAYRSVVAKKKVAANPNNRAGAGAGTGAAVVGGAAVFGAAAAATAAANANANDSEVRTTQSAAATAGTGTAKMSPLRKGTKSVRMMLGISFKKGTAPAATAGAVPAAVGASTSTDAGVPDDEFKSFSRRDPTRSTGPLAISTAPSRDSNVRVLEGVEGEVAIERTVSSASGKILANLRSRTRSLKSAASFASASASASAAKKKKKKKKKPRVHGWRSVADEKTGKTYYYHTLTKETRWDKPEDYDEALDKRRSSKKKKKASSSQANKPKRAIWKEATDQNSGKTYYFHTITKEVTWIKPAGFDEQQEQLQREQEERRRKRAEEKEKRRAAAVRSAAASGGPAFDPVHLELQNVLARALPGQQEQHDRLLEQYDDRERDLLKALEELQEDTPFDENIEYDAVVAKMDQIEARESGVGVVAAAAASSAAAAASQAPPRVPTRNDAPSIGRTYSTYTSGTGMRSEMTERVNNVTKSAGLPGVAPIAEGAEEDDDDETSISSKHDEDAAAAAADADAAHAALQKTEDAVRTRSQMSNRSNRSARLNTTNTDSYAGDNEHDDHYSVSDSVSALSTDIESAGLRARQERRKKKALGAAMEEKDWNKAATVAQELSKRERSDDVSFTVSLVLCLCLYTTALAAVTSLSD